MAVDFRVEGFDITVITEVTLLTVPANSTYIVGSIILSNKHISTASSATLTLRDTSKTTDFNILTSEAFAVGVSKEILSRPLVLENGDLLKITAANADVFDVLISYMDRSRN